MPLIGRDREVAEVASLFSEDGARLVTLLGPGGVGKTRLALEVAGRLAEGRQHGMAFVDLSAVSDAGLAPAAIAVSIGLRLSGSGQADAEFIEALRERDGLLVLDNLEQVLDVAELVAELLSACPTLTLLATSRAPLRISEEFAYPVSPLGLDPIGDGDGLADQPASVQLFVARARRARATFTLTREDAPVVAEICRHLDGLPLAIELAAARVALFPPAALLARLPDRLGLLTSGDRDRPARQQTLRDTIGWSYDLLNSDERNLFRRLAVVVGGCPMEAAARLAVEGLDVESVVASLVDVSLIQIDVAPDGEPRLAMLETIRAYALERLEESGEATEARGRQRAWMVDYVERLSGSLAGGGPAGSGAARTLAALDLELGNARAALGWAEEGGSVEHGLALVAALAPFWEVRGGAAEGRGWADRFLARADDSPRMGTARALAAGGRLAELQGDYPAAQRRYESALTMWRELGDRRGEALVRSHLGGVRTAQGDYVGSKADNEAALAIYADLGDQAGVARALLRLGAVAYRRNDMSRAEAHWADGLAIQRALGDRYEQSGFLNNLGLIATHLGRLERAQLLLEENLALTRELQDRRGIAIALLNLAQVAHGRGEDTYAETLLEEALAIFTEVDDRQGLVTALTNLGTVALERRDHGEAARLYHRSMALAEEIGDRRSVALGRANLAGVSMSLGDHAGAESLARESLTRYEAIGDEVGAATARLLVGHALVDSGPHDAAHGEALAALTALGSSGGDGLAAQALELMARIAGASGRHTEATRWLGRAVNTRELTRLAPTSWETTRRESLIAHLRERLGEAPFQAAWDAGAATPLNEIISAAAAWDPTAAAERAPAPFGLTPRELEVLRLIAEGCPDREIADRLFLSPRTVGGHVTNILNKLGVSTRSAATALAVRQGIV